MKKIFYLFIIFQSFCLNLFSQSDLVEKDSLSVFVITDENMMAILDSFIMNAQQSIYYPSVTFAMHISLYDDGDLSLRLDLSEKKYPDSVVLYKNPYCHQAFVLHSNKLFQVDFRSYFDVTNYCKLTELLKKQSIKQCVYFKRAPMDFYDSIIFGELDYETLLSIWACEYSEGEWLEISQYDYIRDN